MTYQPLFQLIKPVRGAMLAAAFASALAAVIGVFPYVAITEIARSLLTPGAPDNTWTWVAIGIASFVVSHLLYVGSLGKSHQVDAVLRCQLRTRIAERLQRVSLGWFSQSTSGEIRKAVVDDVAAIHTLVAHAGSDVTRSVVAPLAGFVYLFIADWRLALVMLGWLVVVFVGVALWTSRSRFGKESYDEFSRAQADMSTAAVEIVDGIAEVKNYGLGGQLFARYDQALTRFSDSSYQWMSSLGIPLAIVTSCLRPAAVMVPVLAAGAWFAGAGWMDPVSLLPFLTLGIGIPQAMVQMASISQMLTEAVYAAQHTAELLEVPALPEPEHPQPLQGSAIEFDQVEFAYTDDHPVLRGVSVRFEAGATTALVGPSGSGKTTMMRLISRFWDVSEGAVRVGGADVRDVSSSALLNNVAIVFQGADLLLDTVRHNIALARPDASFESIVAAAKAACIHDRIMQLPHGYDTVIGVDGGHLSGGERQRLTLARAFVQDAPILLLDEATAWADPHSEREIQRALSRLARGRTVVVIAHRLASIVDADKIVVLDAGQVVSEGTHEQLLAEGGVYRRLWNAQNRMTEGVQA